MELLSSLLLLLKISIPTAIIGAIILPKKDYSSNKTNYYLDKLANELKATRYNKYK